MPQPPPPPPPSPLFISATLALLLAFVLVLILRPTPAMPSATTTPATTTTTTTLELPPDAKLFYLAEGAANIIYRVSTPSSPHASSRLLRLRKTLPSAQPNDEAYAYLSSTAFPMLPQHLLITTELIALPPGLLEQENERLLRLEAASGRPKKRIGMYLETQERFGFLIADMSPHSPRQVLVEFKPKWLAQSPSAPKDAVRCRTCALRLKKSGGPSFCPLDLASGVPERVRRAVRYLLPQTPPQGFEPSPGWREALEEIVVTFVVESELMPVLVSLQRRLDPNGPLGEMGESFSNAMTVRDLTVFLRVDLETRMVDCGVGDLDLKVGTGGKYSYWRETESGLIEGGWYRQDGGWKCEL